MFTEIQRPYRSRHRKALFLPEKIVDLQNQIEKEGEGANRYIREFLTYLDRLGNPLSLEFPVSPGEVDPLISAHLGQTPDQHYLVILTTNTPLLTRLLIKICANPSTRAQRSVTLCLWPTRTDNLKIEIDFSPFEPGKQATIAACARDPHLARILLAATLGDIRGPLQAAAEAVRAFPAPSSR